MYSRGWKNSNAIKIRKLSKYVKLIHHDGAEIGVLVWDDISEFDILRIQDMIRKMGYKMFKIHSITRTLATELKPWR